MISIFQQENTSFFQAKNHRTRNNFKASLYVDSIDVKKKKEKSQYTFPSRIDSSHNIITPSASPERR